MTPHTTRRGLAAAGLIAASLAVAQCGGSSLIGPTQSGTITIIRLESGERATSQAMNNAMASSQASYNKAVSGGAAPPASLLATLAGGALVPNRATACVATSVKYYNAQSQEQPIYDPKATTRAKATGTCNWSTGTATFDLTLDDMLASSSSYLVNGTTVGTYEGAPATGTLTNVRVPKTACPYPTSGKMTVQTGQTTITVTCDGTNMLTGTYVLEGRTITFTIPLVGIC
jgi:hypothetical protein